jgi:hypothetical protein
MAWESYAELVATKPFSSSVPWERAALACQIAEQSCQSWQTERRSRQTVGRSRQPQSPAQARKGQDCMYMNGGFDCDWWSLHSHAAARSRTVECLHTDTAVSNRERKGERGGLMCVDITLPGSAPSADSTDSFSLSESSDAGSVCCMAGLAEACPRACPCKHEKVKHFRPGYKM